MTLISDPKGFPLWTSLATFAGVATMLFAVPGGSLEESVRDSEYDVRLWIGWAHVLGLGAVFVLRRFVMRFDAPHELPASDAGRASWRQYQAGLDGLILHWVALYGVLVYAWSQPPGFEETDAGRVAMACVELLNAAGGLLYFFLFFVLDRPTVATSAEPGRDAHFREAWLMVLAVSALAAFGAALARLGRVPGESFAEVARHGSPVVVAIGMMYLFGRFDRATMGVRPLVVAPLWGYVALQATWARASGPEDLVSAGVFALAFLLKLYFLALQVVWSRDGRLQRRLEMG
ncbi:hypothetical protein Poly30_13490 [Planctomycetes bacterium Poly30]|uniref:Uncharacterized protein n=1 Tax=Saltatorellus ferox TaxID=2528018 RepID=A0A518EP43_9BACT|nr:hypothetical protein Poly30_13490 [Planctomycetes bacterium Poly30]